MADTKSLVPSFIVHFDGARLPVEREADIKEIIVTDTLDNPSTFSLIVSDQENEWKEKDDFYAGSEVKIKLGYKDAVEPVIWGEVTGIQCQFHKNQPDKVIINGKNHLHKLCRNKRYAAYSGITVKDIISELAGNAGLSTDLEELTFEHVFTLQSFKTDFEYLLSIAEKYDCYFHVRDKKLIFKRLARNLSEDLTLEYGKTLRMLSLTAETSRIISEVEVRGWDYEKSEAVIGSSAFGDIEAAGGSVVDENWGAARAIIIDYSVMDQAEADERALDILARNARVYITGTGSAEGDPKLLAGTILLLKGLGEKFSGKYFVTRACHHLKIDGGYITQFTLTGTIASGNASGSSDNSAGSQSSTSAQEQPAEQTGTEKQGQDEEQEEKQKIEFQCFDSKHNPVKKIKYILTTPDGEEKGETDDAGKLSGENITKGDCTIRFCLNEDTETGTEIAAGKKYRTGRSHIITFPVFVLRIEIDPSDPESENDTYCVFSTDNAKAYKKTLKAKENKIPGDNYIDLHFPGVVKDLQYTLEITPESGAASYCPFKNVSL